MKYVLPTGEWPLLEKPYHDLMKMVGLTGGITVGGNLMSATELNNFFTSLGTAVGAPTIIVTGNPGAATCNTAIAKGFIVTII